ncbi:MAG: efflux RND transporter periplasmic adaptor subunit [Planctomycetes bacterium]|nr:efflux RND transporter periplasmic adaptor subunit [Planctomycetota bacterium]
MERGARRVVLVLAAAGLVGGGLWAALRPPPLERRHVVSAGEVVAEALGTGTLEARVGVMVAPEVTGRLVEVTVDEGDPVKAGDLLLRVDDTELQRQVLMAAADLQAAEASLARATAETTRAQAVADAAARELARVRELAARTILPAADLDRATDAHAVADAGLAAARAGAAEASRRQEAAAQGLAVREARLAESRVRSPVDGLVVRRLREPGDVVIAGGPVLSIVATREMWVRAWVDESELPRLAPGLPARVVFRAEPGRDLPGVVARVGREVDRETREVLVDVRVEALPAAWAVGQRADVFITVARARAEVVLPVELLTWRGGAVGAHVLEGARARWRPLALGLRGASGVEVREGLAAGDVVVGAPGGGAGPGP